jgi:hypothetical protein
MLGNISYHQYITTARLQINFTNRVKDMLKFAAQVSPAPFPLFPVLGGSGDPAEMVTFFDRSVLEPVSLFDMMCAVQMRPFFLKFAYYSL